MTMDYLSSTCSQKNGRKPVDYLVMARGMLNVGLYGGVKGKIEGYYVLVEKFT
jgi:hypothetical protein